MSTQHAIPTQPANIVRRDGRDWWQCPCCKKQTLGEITASSVIILGGRGRNIIIAGGQTMQTCPTCGGISTYTRNVPGSDGTN